MAAGTYIKIDYSLGARFVKFVDNRCTSDLLYGNRYKLSLGTQRLLHIE